MLDNILNKVVPNIIQNEGFSSKPYIDILVRKKLKKEHPKDLEVIEKHLSSLKLTVGYGSLVNLSQNEALLMARHRLEKKFTRLVKIKPIVLKLPIEAQVVLAEMIYQMGVTGVRGFRNMWRSIEEFDFANVAYHMADSHWYKNQTTNRAQKLCEQMASIA